MHSHIHSNTLLGSQVSACTCTHTHIIQRVLHLMHVKMLKVQKIKHQTSMRPTLHIAQLPTFLVYFMQQTFDSLTCAHSRSKNIFQQACKYNFKPQKYLSITLCHALPDYTTQPKHLKALLLSSMIRFNVYRERLQEKLLVTYCYANSASSRTS